MSWPLGSISWIKGLIPKNVKNSKKLTVKKILLINW